MTIFQVGSNDGNDHVFEFVSQTKEIIDRIILIDASESCVEKTKQHYKNIPNVECYNYAVVSNDNEKFAKLYFPVGDDASAHTSMSVAHMHKHGHGNLKEVEVQAYSLNELFDKFSLQHIDRLYIDVEGFDIDLINSIDFSKIKIDYLVFEYIHSDGPLTWGGPKLEECLQKLSNLGYKLQKVEYNIIATL